MLFQKGICTIVTLLPWKHLYDMIKTDYIFYECSRIKCAPKYLLVQQEVVTFMKHKLSRRQGKINPQFKWLISDSFFDFFRQGSFIVGLWFLEIPKCTEIILDY